MTSQDDLIQQLIDEMEKAQLEFFKDEDHVKIIEDGERVESSAYIGMFWFLEGDLIILNDKTLVSEIKAGSSIKQYPIAHFEVWDEYVKKYPEYEYYNKQSIINGEPKEAYTYPPRGRVSAFITNGLLKFTVFIPKQLDTKEFRQQVIKEFNLFEYVKHSLDFDISRKHYVTSYSGYIEVDKEGK